MEGNSAPWVCSHGHWHTWSRWRQACFMVCFGGSGACKRVISMDSGEGEEKSMLTNSMRELTSSQSPGAGKLHFLPKLLVQGVARNCELELLLNRPLDLLLNQHNSMASFQKQYPSAQSKALQFKPQNFPSSWGTSPSIEHWLAKLAQNICPLEQHSWILIIGMRLIRKEGGKRSPLSSRGLVGVIAVIIGDCVSQGGLHLRSLQASQGWCGE